MRIDKVYQKLKEEFSDEEITESFMIPETDSVKEEQGHYAISKYREERLKEMSGDERTVSKVLQIKYLIQEYVEQESFSFKKTFGTYLEKYIDALGRTRKEISEEIDVHYTKLSRIVNDKEEPSIELCFRLEKHSGNLISAIVWWQLIKKKEEFIISQDIEPKRVEQRKVKNSLTVADNLKSPS